MTVSCQSQNLTIVPAGVPYDSQRVFLQNNRITELRADSFGFETQVKMTACVFASVYFPRFICRQSFMCNSLLCLLLMLVFSPNPVQVLWLYANNITWIEAGAFSNLRVLEELDLGDNPLQRLEGGAFRGLEKLQSLHMHRCKLAALPHDLFHKLYSLQFLYLQVNPAHIQTKYKRYILCECTHMMFGGIWWKFALWAFSITLVAKLQAAHPHTRFYTLHNERLF